MNTKRSSKKRTQAILFICLFALLAAVAFLLMPNAKVWAYTWYCGGSDYAREGSLTIKKVDAEGNYVSGAQVTITAQRYFKQSDSTFVLGNDTDSVNNYGVVQEIPAGGLQVGNNYLDNAKIGTDYADQSTYSTTFEDANESKAYITIAETPPPGYQQLGGNIKLLYEYKTEDSGWSGFVPADGASKYQLSVSIEDNPNDAMVSLDDSNAPNYVLWIENTLALPDAGTGDLKITKALAGNDAETNKDFSFTATFTYGSGEPYAEETFGTDTTDANGKITFSLKGGETKTISGIPEGAYYTVVEDDYSGDDYAVTWTRASTDGDLDPSTGNPNSVMSADASHAYTATNTRNSYGNLKVSKTTAGVNKDKISSFDFKVTLSDNSINGTYGDMTFADGVATFSLADGVSQTATGLPVGITYTVTEEDYSADGYVTTTEGDTGTIARNATAECTFTNTRAANGTLTVVKKLEGNNTSTTDEFTFEVALSDTSFAGTVSDIEFSGGKGQFTLTGGGGSKIIDSLPHGVTYTVTETDSLDYESSHSGNTGTIDEDAPAVVTFTNTRNTTDPDPDPDSETVVVAATKVWSDEDDVDGKRADAVLRLMNGNTQVVDTEDQTIAKDATGNDLTVSWTVPKNDSSNNAITYTVAEVDSNTVLESGATTSNGYTVSYSGNMTEGFTVTNSYTPASPDPDPDPDPDSDPTPATVNPQVSKAVTGTTAKDKFTFTLAPVSNTVGVEVADMPLPSGASNVKAQVEQKGAGEFTFGEFAFSQPGTYVYKVTEDKGTIAGYTYDTSVYQLTYTVAESNGALTADAAITKDGDAVDKLLFTNVYSKPITPKTPSSAPTSTPKVSSTAKTADPISSGALATLVCALVLAVVGMRAAKKRSQ